MKRIAFLAIIVLVLTARGTGNLGGGLFVFFNKHIGVRGDLRYFRAYGFDLGDLQGASGRTERPRRQR